MTLADNEAMIDVIAELRPESPNQVALSSILRTTTVQVSNRIVEIYHAFNLSTPFPPRGG